ncbi:NAD-dependent epimerase/dehydratase family protein [Mariprofundus ferrooxydans]|nr:NAD-dependent epimerase/dehydratase family protein [Mariprofundus ferrooxydans]
MIYVDGRREERDDNMNVLITGATGFIGQHLYAALVENGSNVRMLGRTRPDGTLNYVHWDMNQPLDAKALDGIDVVFHLAGKAHALNADYHDDVEYFTINTAGTRKLLEAAKSAGVRRFVYFSSIKAVGYHEHCSDESCEELPDTMYGRSKLMAEQLVLSGGFVPEPVVIRPTMVYGCTEKGNLPKMIQAIRKWHFPPLPDTRNYRSMIHVDDVVSAALLLSQHPEAVGKCYIASDSHNYSTRQMYVWICEALGQPVPGWKVPVSLLKLIAVKGDMIGKIIGRRFIFDSETLQKLLGTELYSSAKIEKELGFCPQRHLHESLPEIVNYLKNNHDSYCG